MTDDGGCEVSAATFVERPHSLLYDAAVQLSVTSALGLTIWQETVWPVKLDRAWRFGHEQQSFLWNKIGHI